MADWIPEKDSELKNFVNNMVEVIGSAPADFGLSSAQAGELSNAVNTWLGAYTTTLNTQALLYASVINQDALRKALETMLRAYHATVRAAPKVSDARCAAAGFPMRDASGMHAAAPKTAPVVGKVIIMGAGHLIVEYRDRGTPDTKEKPAGVREAEIWAKVGGPAPADGDACAYIGSGSASQFLAVFDEADGGKPLWFCLRWKNTHGEVGPWGPVFSTMVPGGSGAR